MALFRLCQAEHCEKIATKKSTVNSGICTNLCKEHHSEYSDVVPRLMTETLVSPLSEEQDGLLHTCLQYLRHNKTSPSEDQIMLVITEMLEHKRIPVKSENPLARSILQKLQAVGEVVDHRQLVREWHQVAESQEVMQDMAELQTKAESIVSQLSRISERFVSCLVPGTLTDFEREMSALWRTLQEGVDTIASIVQIKDEPREELRKSQPSVVLEEVERKGYGQKVDSVACAQSFLVVAGSANDFVLHNTSSQTESLLYIHTSPIICVALHPSSEQAAFAGKDKAIQVWDTTSSSLQATLKGHKKQITAIRFRPTAAELVSASKEQDIRVWSVSQETLLYTLSGHMGGSSSLDCALNGKYLVSGGRDRFLHLWDLGARTKVVSRECLKKVRAVAFSLCCSYVASGSGENAVRVYSLVDRTESELTKHTRGVNALAFSRKYLATGGADSKLILWCLDTWQPVSIFDKVGAIILAVAFVHFEDSICTGDKDGWLKLFSLKVPGSPKKLAKPC